MKDLIASFNPYIGLIKIGGVVLAILVLVGLGAFYMHKHDAKKYDALKAEYNTFVDKTALLGHQAEVAKAAKEAADKSKKERADAENQRSRSDVKSVVAGVRDKAPSSSFVPSAASTSKRPDLICFDRAEYQRADGIFTQGARGLADKGTESTLDLNTAKRWAQSP